MLLDTIVNGLKKFEQEWEREFNQYQWVLRYYVILSHYNGKWNWAGTGNLGNGFPTHSGTNMVTLQENLW